MDEIIQLKKNAPLGVELAYVISRLHYDTYPDLDIDHKIIFTTVDGTGNKFSTV